MDIRRKQNNVGVQRQEECRSLVNDIDRMIGYLTRAKHRAEAGAVAEPDVRVNITTDIARELTNQTQTIARSTENIARFNAILSLLDDLIDKELEDGTN